MVESCVIAVADCFVIAAAIDFYFTFLAFNLVEELSFNLKIFCSVNYVYDCNGFIEFKLAYPGLFMTLHKVTSASFLDKINEQHK